MRCRSFGNFRSCRHLQFALCCGLCVGSATGTGTCTRYTFGTTFCCFACGVSPRLLVGVGHRLRSMELPPCNSLWVPSEVSSLLYCCCYGCCTVYLLFPSIQVATWKFH